MSFTGHEREEKHAQRLAFPHGTDGPAGHRPWAGDAAIVLGFSFRDGGARDVFDPQLRDAWTGMSGSPVFSTIDYGRSGKQVGQIRIPRSTNESGWSHLFLPVICIANGSGPTALVTGGVHGDEPEGQIAALNLARQTRAEDVRGRLIILPCLSPEASRAYT